MPKNYLLTQDLQITKESGTESWKRSHQNKHADQYLQRNIPKQVRKGTFTQKMSKLKKKKRHQKSSQRKKNTTNKVLIKIQRFSMSKKSYFTGRQVASYRSLANPLRVSQMRVSSCCQQNQMIEMTAHQDGSVPERLNLVVGTKTAQLKLYAARAQRVKCNSMQRNQAMLLVLSTFHTKNYSKS